MKTVAIFYEVKFVKYKIFLNVLKVMWCADESSKKKKKAFLKYCTLICNFKFYFK